MAEHTGLVNPKQFEIINYIKQYIKKNQLNEGDKLPSENKLAEQFEVNRNVVRSALSHLSAQGHIYSEKGRGFFVSAKPKPILFDHDNGLGFSEVMGTGTRNYQVQLISNTTIAAGPALGKLLSIPAEEKVYLLKILRLLEGEPFAICHSYLPSSKLPDFDKHLENFTTVNRIIMEDYGFPHPFCGNLSIESCMPTAEDIDLLKMPLQMPILKQNEVFYVDQNTTIEYFCVRARGDRFKFRMSFAEDVQEAFGDTV